MVDNLIVFGERDSISSSGMYVMLDCFPEMVMDKNQLSI